MQQKNLLQYTYSVCDMPRVYDDWEKLVSATLDREKLVSATLDREKLRQLALSSSFSSTSSSDINSRRSFDSSPVNEASRISSEIINPRIQPIRLGEIKKAATNFKPDDIRLGRFVFYYKGWLQDNTLTSRKPGSGMAVAVEVWRPCRTPMRKEWLDEVNYMSQFHHPNVAKLFGCCFEEDNLLLVYESMPRGSLHSHLFTSHFALENCKYEVSWATRIKLAIGASRALSFLHNKDIPVLHRDFNTTAIYMDEDCNAKLFGFVLANVPDGPIGLGGMAHVSTQIMEQCSDYAAPEYIMTGRLTTKCDVYSFGVVLLELLSGRPVNKNNRVTIHQNLVNWAQTYVLDAEKFVQFMDSKLEGQYPLEEAFAVGKLALLCLSPEPALRLDMADVLFALEHL